MKIETGKKIFIIEGIAGSGKTSLLQALKKQLKNKTVYHFTEEELLFSWKHFWIKNIEKIRFEFMNKLLDYIEEKINLSNNFFILERFHISLEIMSAKMDTRMKRKYELLIKRLKSLPVQIFITTLKEEEIKARSVHSERKDKIWENHRKERLKAAGFDNLVDLYLSEQRRIINLAKSQNIPYSIITVPKQKVQK